MDKNSVYEKLSEEMKNDSYELTEEISGSTKFDEYVQKLYRLNNTICYCIAINERSKLVCSAITLKLKTIKSMCNSLSEKTEFTKSENSGVLELSKNITSNAVKAKAVKSEIESFYNEIAKLKQNYSSNIENLESKYTKLTASLSDRLTYLSNILMCLDSYENILKYYYKNVDINAGLTSENNDKIIDEIINKNSNDDVDSVKDENITENDNKNTENNCQNNSDDNISDKIDDLSDDIKNLIDNNANNSGESGTLGCGKNADDYVETYLPNENYPNSGYYPYPAYGNFGYGMPYGGYGFGMPYGGYGYGGLGYGGYGYGGLGYGGLGYGGYSGFGGFGTTTYRNIDTYRPIRLDLLYNQNVDQQNANINRIKKTNWFFPNGFTRNIDTYKKAKKSGNWPDF